MYLYIIVTLRPRARLTQAQAGRLPGNKHTNNVNNIQHKQSTTTNNITHNLHTDTANTCLVPVS